MPLSSSTQGALKVSEFSNTIEPSKDQLTGAGFLCKTSSFLSYCVCESKIWLSNISWTCFYSFWLFKLVVAKHIPKKRAASSALPGCILGHASSVVFSHMVCSVKQIHILCSRKTPQSEDTCQWHKDLVKMQLYDMLCRGPLNVHTSYRLQLVLLRDFVLFWLTHYNFWLVLICTEEL